MHLDSRGYAYETYRENGRVCRRFCGSGTLAALLVRMNEIDRERSEEARYNERAKIERVKQGGDALQAYCKASNALFRAAAQAGGYHQHKRGEWRKKRSRSNDMAQASVKGHLPAQLKGATPSQFERAQNGDLDEANSMLATMRNQPEEAEFLELVLPWAVAARESLISIPPDNHLVRGVFHRKIEKMKDELAGPNPTALESHLAERIALCSFRVSALEMQYGKAESFKSRENIDKLLNSANRRYLESVKILAQVRKMQLPNVQINIGEKQVNVGQVVGVNGAS
ncbi:MAG: hypothetical protein EOP10_18425 [Proteobacteria bacterium]|nr:MAG: hypothetical protein EOP10_18425 [Pseudomonadota bacterium]